MGKIFFLKSLGLMSDLAGNVWFNGVDIFGGGFEMERELGKNLVVWSIFRIFVCSNNVLKWVDFDIRYCLSLRCWCWRVAERGVNLSIRC